VVGPAPAAAAAAAAAHPRAPTPGCCPLSSHALELLELAPAPARLPPPQVQRAGRLHEPVARWFFQQLLVGVDYIHRRGVANRDIKLENTLLQVGRERRARGASLPSAVALLAAGRRRSSSSSSWVS
jgi:hypothetical protein